MSLIHASLCIIGRHGVLVRGASGAGKSLLVHLLVEAASARGRFGRWVADDQVQLAAHGDALIARPVAEIAGRAELRFYGIAPVAHAVAARVDLVVDLVEASDRLPDATTASLENIVLPSLAVPQADLNHARVIIETHLSAIRGEN